MPQPNHWYPPSTPSVFQRVARILRSPLFICGLLTFLVTVGSCMHIMPVTYCNDPMDPLVRERIQREWDRKLIEHEEQVAKRELVKARWTWEDEQHEKLVREWAWERIEHERELEERARREEEERKRLDLFWGYVEAHECKTYGTREYTAVLMNLPMYWDQRVQACRNTPLEIHGIPYLPKTCEDRGTGGMIGMWEVTQQEPECTPYWDSYNDKGCTSPGSKKKYVTHKLENLPKNSDWREFCATTPADFDHMHFPGAPECIESVWGIYGQWEIEANNC